VTFTVFFFAGAFLAGLAGAFLAVLVFTAFALDAFGALPFLSFSNSFRRFPLFYRQL
jgi:hypothetical protein